MIRQVNVSCPLSPRLNAGKEGMIAGYRKLETVQFISVLSRSVIMEMTKNFIDQFVQTTIYSD